MAAHLKKRVYEEFTKVVQVTAGEGTGREGKGGGPPARTNSPPPAAARGAGGQEAAPGQAQQVGGAARGPVQGRLGRRRAAAPAALRPPACGGRERRGRRPHPARALLQGGPGCGSAIRSLPSLSVCPSPPCCVSLPDLPRATCRLPVPLA